MGIQETKAWLNRAYKIDEEIKELIEERDKSFLAATRTVNGTDKERVHTSRKNATEDKFVSYTAYSEELDSMIDTYYKTKREIVKTIRSIPDGVSRRLLFK